MRPPRGLVIELCTFESPQDLVAPKKGQAEVATSGLNHLAMAL